MNRRFWIWTFVLSLTVALTVMLWRCCPRTVPLSQCSVVYQRYHDVPGIQAAFIKNKRINDTIEVDMTLFSAADSASFANMLSFFGKSEEFIRDISKIHNPKARFVGTFPKMANSSSGNIDWKDNDVMAIFPSRRCIAFFHIETLTEFELVLDGNLFKKIKL